MLQVLYTATSNTQSLNCVKSDSLALKETEGEISQKFPNIFLIFILFIY